MSVSRVFHAAARPLQPVRRLQARAKRELASALNHLRSARDLGLFAPARFRRERRGAEYQRVFSDPQPRVSLCIATYNRSELLIERSVRSALNQTYSNLEIIVVGDCCTDDTTARMAEIKDDRLRFVNLPERGKYPEDPSLRWMVAGSTPMNHALSLATGDFITHLDDDDEHAPDRVEKLVRHIQQTRADIVYHPFLRETAPDLWSVNQAARFGYARVTTSSIFYHRWFRAVPWDLEAYRYREPGDWNRLRKFLYLGARAVRYPEPLLRHYRERNQRSPGA